MPTQTTIVHLLHAGVWPIIHAVQNETGRTVKMVLDDFALASGYTGRLYFSRPDHTKYSTPATLVLADNAFTADLTQGLTRPGKVECQLKITISSEVVSTLTFIINVERDVNSVTASQLGYSIEDIQALADQAEAAASAAQTVAETYVIDKSLSEISDHPVQNSAVTKALGTLSDSIDPYSIHYFGGIAEGMISYTTGDTLTSQTGVYSYTDYIDVTGYETITYRQIHSTYASESSVTFGMAFYDESLNFVSGDRAAYHASSRHYTTETITVPSTAVYARFTVLTSDAEDGPFWIRYSTQSLGEALNSMQENIDFINGYLEGLWSPVDIDAIGTMTVNYPRATGWQKMSNYGGGLMIPRAALGSAIKVTGTSQNNYSVVLLLGSDVDTAGTEVVYADYDCATRININSGESRVIAIPEQEVCPYVWISTTYSTRDAMRPEEVAILSGQQVNPVVIQNEVNELRKIVVEAIVNNKSPVLSHNIEVMSSADISEIIDSLDSSSAATPSSGVSNNVYRDVPSSRGALNAYKKAHQLLDLTYTPKEQMVYDKDAGTDVLYFPANTPVTGMVYSSTKELDKIVGVNVSIRTFMTAINNPLSVLYTECVHSNHSATAYGKTYHGRNCATYYGTICSGLISYALGLSDLGYHMYTNDVLRYMCDQGIFERVYDSSSQGVQLMDVIWVPGHVRLITDVYRDSRGVVKKVCVTESVHPIVKEVVYSDVGDSVRTLADLDSYIQTFQSVDDPEDYPGGLYRYRDLHKNVKYEQSPFVAITEEGETAQSYTYNDSICTYLGDYPCIADWEDMYLNFTKGSYDTILVKKEDGTMVDSYNITTYTDTLKLNYHGPGKFKACLHKSNDSIPDSEYTHWEVIDTTVTLVNSGRIEFSSVNGKPTYIRFSYYGGSYNWGADRGVLLISDKDRENGYITFNYTKLIHEQAKTVPAHQLYAKVYFKGDYGIVRCNLEDCCLIE